MQQICQRLLGIEEGFKVVSQALEAKCDSLTDVQEILSLMEKLDISRAENARLKAIESKLSISQAENTRLKAIESICILRH